MEDFTSHITVKNWGGGPLLRDGHLHRTIPYIVLSATFSGQNIKCISNHVSSYMLQFHLIFFTSATNTSILGVVTGVETQSSKSVTLQQGTLCPRAVQLV